MPEGFDPYRDWLGIESTVRPLDYYALLKLKPLESDQRRISSHAVAQITLVLPHDPGPQQEIARRIFDELQTALDVLSDPAQKQKYDRQLRSADDSISQYLGDETPADSAVDFEVSQPIPAREAHAVPIPAAEETAAADRTSVALGSEVDDNERSHSATSASRSRATSSGLGKSQSSLASSKSMASSKSIKKSNEKRKKPASESSIARTQAIVAGTVLFFCAVFIASRIFIWDFRPDPKNELLEQLAHADPAMRMAAVQAVGNMGPTGETIPSLLRLLREDKEERVRVAVAEALANTLPEQGKFSDELTQLASTERSEKVRSAIQVAIKALTPK